MTLPAAAKSATWPLSSDRPSSRNWPLRIGVNAPNCWAAVGVEVAVGSGVGAGAGGAPCAGALPGLVLLTVELALEPVCELLEPVCELVVRRTGVGVAPFLI